MTGCSRQEYAKVALHCEVSHFQDVSLSGTEVRLTEGPQFEKSRELYARARRSLPGGVTGEGQFYPPQPLYFESAAGKWLTDVDGNRYLDYHAGFGTAVLGYSHPEVAAAVERATREVGTFVGLPHQGLIDLAELLTRNIPSAEAVAFNGGGGSDSLYVALRLCRSLTGRTKLLKVEGGYHGWHSDLAVSVRPPLDDLPEIVSAVPVSSGSLPAVTREVVVVEVNDKQGLERAVTEHGDEIAMVAIEPVLYSAGCIEIDPEYMSALRSFCDSSGAILVFDEMISGIRNGLGGAGASFEAQPDLSVFGKAFSNGYIISALVGRRDLIDHLTPAGPAFFSGTFNGHPLSVAAALATLKIVERDDVPAKLERLTRRLVNRVNGEIDRLGLHAVCQGRGSVWTIYFLTDSVKRYRDVGGRDPHLAAELTREFFSFMRKRGIYAHQRAFIRCFISNEHDEEDIDRTVGAVAEFLESKSDLLVRA